MDNSSDTTPPLTRRGHAGRSSLTGAQQRFLDSLASSTGKSHAQLRTELRGATGVAYVLESTGATIGQLREALNDARQEGAAARTAA